MLAHTYPHKPLRKIKVTMCNHQADSQLCIGLMSDLVNCKFRKIMVIHDTECPYWDQVSLNNTNLPWRSLQDEISIYLLIWYYDWYLSFCVHSSILLHPFITCVLLLEFVLSFSTKVRGSYSHTHSIYWHTCVDIHHKSRLLLTREDQGTDSRCRVWTFSVDRHSYCLCHNILSRWFFITKKVVTLFTMLKFVDVAKNVPTYIGAVCDGWCLMPCPVIITDIYLFLFVYPNPGTQTVKTDFFQTSISQL